MSHKVRLAAVSWIPTARAADGRFDFAALRNVVHEVAKDRPHFICFPEICAALGQDRSAAVKGADELGPFVEEVGKIAREVKAALLVPLLERAGPVVYNSVPVVDSAGKLVMNYRKNYPTVGEMNLGMHPGTEVPVAECDGVPVGVAVCFDINFPPVAEALERQRPKVVFFPSMFLAGQLAQHWAIRYGFYVVVSHFMESSVIDMTGRYLVKQGPAMTQVSRKLLPPWALAEVELERELIHLDYNQEKFPRIREKYGADVEIDPHPPEAFAYLTSRREGLKVADVMKEFELEPAGGYFTRSIAMRESLLKAMAEHPACPQ